MLPMHGLRPLTWHLSQLSTFITTWSSRPALMDELWNMLHRLGTSTAFRERSTFVACCQEIALAKPQHAPLISDTVLGILAELSKDRIVDVRIRLARLFGIYRGTARIYPSCFTTNYSHRQARGRARECIADDSAPRPDACNGRVARRPSIRRGYPQTLACPCAR